MTKVPPLPGGSECGWERGLGGEGPREGAPSPATRGRVGEGASGRVGEGASGRVGEGASGRVGEGASGRVEEGASGRVGEKASGSVEEGAYWHSFGLPRKAAQSLAAAGLSNLVDLEGHSRADLRRIPGIGRASLAILGDLLGWPLPSGIIPTPETLWRRRGLPHQAAVTFAQVGMSLGRLSCITRQELLALHLVGPISVRVCERLLGHPIPSGNPRDPVADFWKSQGLPPKAARALSRAGIASLEDLRSASREDLLALSGIGPVVLRQLEALLGKKIPGRSSCWLDKGLSLYIANALVRAGIQSLPDLAALSRKQFLALPGLGLYALKQCERKLRLRLPTES